VAVSIRPTKHLAAFLVALAGVAAVAQPSAPGNREVSNPSEGFSIVCPEGWEAKKDAQPAAAACIGPSEGEDDFIENLLVLTSPAPEGANAETMLRTAIAENPDFGAPHDERTIRGDDWSATSLLVDAKDSARVLVVASVATRGRLFMFLGSAQDAAAMARTRDTFEATMRSFRLEEGQDRSALLHEGPETGRYTNHAMGLAIAYPTTWSVVEGAAGPSSIALLSPAETDDDPFREHVTVLVRDYASPVDLAELAQTVPHALARTFTDLTVLNARETVVDGWPTVRFTIAGKQKGVELKGLVSVSAKGSRSYMMTCLAPPATFAAYVETFFGILDGAEYE